MKKDIMIKIRVWRNPNVNSFSPVGTKRSDEVLIGRKSNRWAYSPDWDENIHINISIIINESFCRNKSKFLFLTNIILTFIIILQFLVLLDRSQFISMHNVLSFLCLRTFFILFGISHNNGASTPILAPCETATVQGKKSVIQYECN